VTFKSVFILVASLAFWMLFWGLRCGVLPIYVSAPVTRKHEARTFVVTAVIYLVLALTALVVAVVI
jgi:hypothetical protein